MITLRKEEKVRFQQDQNNQEVIQEPKQKGENVDWWTPPHEDMDYCKDTLSDKKNDCECKPRLQPRTQIQKIRKTC